ncbi:hypothetical protein CIPAW_11G160000 [Carya illinoinensis]|uniref:Uncharacterized protein n=1 Tax=Carya illinoinensis TaxID=32201 RepID=A0A8T1NMJ6_CARIL|nr:hypothetical protein CIPAW_13G102400 [Carya illinoinensis]KAG6631606.1 hypothetical protein CIPAW_13G102400 [Carya illinoinensis]KAG6637155.1 hypothetical protein CIPAW_11G160000 [Carya illinoinensis]KAG6637156.1 hypothetical protein CIPAW_11G160000 [Carya illinoinensis]KAG6637157.1 hypothetical protein CIPAW_11G160000 [Carya illinoinensis]
MGWYCCGCHSDMDLIIYLLGMSTNIFNQRESLTYSSDSQPHQFTILVCSIPFPSGGTCSETVELFKLMYFLPFIYVELFRLMSL